MENEEMAVLQQQYEQLHSAVSGLTKSLEEITPFLSKAARKEAEVDEKEQKALDEQKMFKRLVKFLKSEGAVFTKGVPSAPGQQGKSPVTSADQQQEVIQGQYDEEEEEAEEFPEAKSVGVTGEVVKQEEDEEGPPDWRKRGADLEKENTALKAEVETLKSSIPGQISKAVEKKMQEIGWKPIGQTPVKAAATEQVSLFKGQTVDREELIQLLKNKPLAELNEMRFKAQIGELVMPEVK